MDEDFDVDDDFLEALASADARPPPVRQQQQFQPPPAFLPPRIQQPTPQRLDKAPPTASNNASASSSAPKVVQPTPQALPSRSSGSSILVSPRQKGNPVLANIRSMPWEYSDILPDYGLGMTTCALFLRFNSLHHSTWTVSANMQLDSQFEIPPPPP